MALFKLGRLFITPGAIEFCTKNNIDVFALVVRHVNGDYGDLKMEDQQANVRALLDGSRMFSSYKCGDGKLWVITEADRESTTILLPDEY